MVQEGKKKYGDALKSKSRSATEPQCARQSIVIAFKFGCVFKALTVENQFTIHLYISNPWL